LKLFFNNFIINYKPKQKMKKITCLALLICMIACKKETKKPEPQKPCNCGVIVSDDASDYSVVIKNDCTGNNEKFYLYASDWFDAYVGKNWCITNEQKW